MTGLSTTTKGVGRRLVLVHGFTQTGRSWDTIADDLASDHQVVTIDAPGHGDSSEIRADLVGGAELLGKAGLRAAYVGYSMGGRLCLHLALARPTIVERLVLLGATAGLDSEAERAERRSADELLAAGLERDGVDPFLDRWLSNPMFAGLPDDPAALADRRRNTVAGLASSLRLAGTGAQQPLWDRVGELEMPVLVLAGEHDTKFRALAERLTAAIGDNACHAIVPGAGHASHLEQPAAFVDVLRDFLG